MAEKFHGVSLRLIPSALKRPANASIGFSISNQKLPSAIHSMPELDPPQRQAPDSLMLTGFWYRALAADSVHRNQLHQATLLEIPLVIGRDRTGSAFALRDACPHRGMPLHCGNFDGENVECSYHGWQFDAHDGQCRLIPALTADQNLKVDRIYAGSYPCQEQDDFIWVYIPEPVPHSAGFTVREEAPDPAPLIEKFS